MIIKPTINRKVRTAQNMPRLTISPTMNNEPPERNERYARYLTLNMTRTLDELTDTYAKAKSRNDAALYRSFNKLRESVQAQVDFLTTIRDEFPQEEAERIDLAIENGRHALAQVDAIPEDVELSDNALENFTRRLLATHTASAHNLVHPPAPSFPPIRSSTSAGDVGNAERRPLNLQTRMAEPTPPSDAEFTPAFPEQTTSGTRTTSDENANPATPIPRETEPEQNDAPEGREKTITNAEPIDEAEPEIIWENAAQQQAASAMNNTTIATMTNQAPTRETTTEMPPELASFLRIPHEPYNSNHEERLTPFPPPTLTRGTAATPT